MYREGVDGGMGRRGLVWHRGQEQHTSSSSAVTMHSSVLGMKKYVSRAPSSEHPACWWSGSKQWSHVMFFFW